MFGELLDARGSRRPHHGLALAASAVAQLAVVSTALALHEASPRPARPIEVALVAPRLAMPAPSPAPPAPGPTPRRTPRRIASAPLVQPRTIPVPAPSPVEPDDSAPVTSPEGVIGGGSVSPPGPDEAAPVAGPPAAIEARPADLASVRTALSRTFVYPTEARRRGWAGRVVLAFTLEADGRLRDLEVRSGSGYPILDEAALEAVRRAAPFDAPGVPVRVVIPVSFRLY